MFSKKARKTSETVTLGRAFTFQRASTVTLGGQPCSKFKKPKLLRGQGWFSLNSFVVGSRIALGLNGELAGPCFWISKPHLPSQDGHVKDGRKGAHGVIHILRFLAEGSDYPSA